MNAPIARLFVVVVVLFAVLVGFTSRWTVFDANALRDNPKNRRELLEEQKIRRGLIRAGDGAVLARSLKQPDGSYVRTYPPGRLFSHAVGYSFVRQGRAGLERFYDDDLVRAQRRARLAPGPPVGLRAAGRQPRHLARPGRAARRPAAARRAQGRRRGAGPAHGRDQGHGLGPGL